MQGRCPVLGTEHLKLGMRLRFVPLDKSQVTCRHAAQEIGEPRLRNILKLRDLGNTARRCNDNLYSTCGTVLKKSLPGMSVSKA